MFHATHRGRAGFTIIELAMALAVFGVITAIAVLRTGPALERARVNRAAAVVAGDLQYAQLVAARQRRPVAVVVSPGAQAYLIRDTQSATVFRQRGVGPGTDVGIDSLAVAPATVTVFPNGLMAQTTTFTIGFHGHVKRVRVTRAGQIRITS